MSRARKEVEAALLAEASQIRKAGADHWKEMERRHPNIPLGVIAEICAGADMAADEEWWESIEKTIDGEIVKNALTKHG